MKNEDEFKKIISRSFWDHIRKNSYLPIYDQIDRSKFCQNIYQEIINKTYRPDPPREYVISDKFRGATRLIPILSLKDNCVYYYCVKSLEDCLAEGYVDCTFGGFRLGSSIKAKEEDIFNEINSIPFSLSQFSYNPKGWTKAWGDFQKKAFNISREAGLNYFIFFDIANFYNSINLTLLENKIRSCANTSLSDEIDLLFYYLKYWDTKLSFYTQKTVGIPMDDFGDSSRLLANFYLQNYDRKVFDYCKTNNSKYLRYADDQIIASPNKETADNILRFCSLELNRIGLNINGGKIQAFQNRNEFEDYWAFEIFDNLLDRHNSELVEKAIIKYIQTDKTKIRWTSVLKRIMNCDLSGISLSIKAMIVAQLFEENFIVGCDHRNLMRLYLILDSDIDRQRYLQTLKNIAEKYLYTQFHYELLLAKKMGLAINFEDLIINRIKELSF